MDDFIGIDVCQQRLDGYSLKANSAWNVPNTPECQAELALRLTGVRRVVVEATGGYQRGIVKALRKAGIEVFVVNPRRIRRFADGIGTLAKTDALDAQVLAHYAFALEMNPKRQTAPTETEEQLRELTTHRLGLVEQKVACKTRLKQLQDPFIRQQLKTLLNTLENLEKSVHHHIRQCIEQTPPLAQKVALLEQMVGIGPIVSSVLLGELPELGQASQQEIAALAGVAPFDCKSGKWQGKSRIFGGRKSVRNALYQGANVARRYDPEMKAYYDHLRAQGKAFKIALVACMRKMLIRLNARVRDAFYSPSLQFVS